MPHKCIKCGKIYSNGDPSLLKGCKCGNKVFVYVPKSKTEASERSTKKEVEVNVLKIEKDKIFPETKIESVRIISPGCYEINIEKIMSRKEIIIALGKDDVYLIHLPSILKTKKD